MKKPLLLIALLIVGSLSYAQDKDINGSYYSVDKIPESIEDFIEFRNKVAETPDGGAAAFLAAMVVYSENQSLGEKCFALTLNIDNLMRIVGGGYKGWAPSRSFDLTARAIQRSPYIARSYIISTYSHNGYALPESPYCFNVLNYRTKIHTDGSAEVYIQSSGSEFPRLLILLKDAKGRWKVKDWSNTFKKVKEPLLNPGEEL